MIPRALLFNPSTGPLVCGLWKYAGMPPCCLFHSPTNGRSFPLTTPAVLTKLNIIP
jgi:hypothetical protein